MINNSIILKFISVINDLIYSEQNPIRSGAWAVRQLHDERRKLWNEMSDEEREIARIKLGKNANKI